MTIDAPGVTPTAAPPITIGPFTNVPAPGSPIRSDWAQQITNYVVTALAPKTLLAVGGGQSIASGTIANFTYTTINNPYGFGGGPVTFTFPVAGLYVLTLKVDGPDISASFADFYIFANGVGYGGAIATGKNTAALTIMNNFQAGQGFYTAAYNPNPGAGNFIPALSVARIPAVP